MKRVFEKSLIVIMVLTLCACGQKVPALTKEVASWQEQYDLGVRYLSEGNYEEAIIAFTAAIEIDPKQATAYVGRGDTYVLSGETEDNLMVAQEDYEKAVELDKKNIDAYIGLANVYVLQNDWQNGWEILQKGYQETDSSIIFEKMNEIQTVIEKSLREENQNIFEKVAELVQSENRQELWSFFYVNQSKIFMLKQSLEIVSNKLSVDTSYGKVLFCLDGEHLEEGFYIGGLQDGKRSGHGILVHAYSQEALSWRILDSDWKNDLPNGQFRWEMYDSVNGMTIREGYLVNGLYDGEIIGKDVYISGDQNRTTEQFNNGRHVPISGPDELGNYLVGEQQWNDEPYSILMSDDLETQFGVFPFTTISY